MQTKASNASIHQHSHQGQKPTVPEYTKNRVSALIRRCDDLPATITLVPVATLLVLNTPDDERLRPKHVEWPCRNKTCTVLHQVGVSFNLYCDARKHKIKIFLICFSFLDGCATVPRVDCSSVAGTRQLAQIYDTFKWPERELSCSAKLCGCRNCRISGSDHYLAEIKAVDSIFNMRSVQSNLCYTSG